MAERETVKFTITVEVAPERPVVLAPQDDIIEAFLDNLGGVPFKVNGTTYDVWNAERAVIAPADFGSANQGDG